MTQNDDTPARGDVSSNRPRYRLDRRRIIGLFGGTIPTFLAGCADQPGNTDGTTSGDVTVSISSRDAQPTVELEYSVEMANATATSEAPASLEVRITNTADEALTVGEERDVQFHHVSSAAETLYLHPADGEFGPVDPGCWQLTEAIAVPEYYGTITLDAGETVQAESYVYGHPTLPEGSCLPAGEHQLQTNGSVGPEGAFDNESELTDFEWGLHLQIGEAET